MDIVYFGWFAMPNKTWMIRWPFMKPLKIVAVAICYVSKKPYFYIPIFVDEVYAKTLFANDKLYWNDAIFMLASKMRCIISYKLPLED